MVVARSMVPPQNAGLDSLWLGGQGQREIRKSIMERVKYMVVNEQQDFRSGARMPIRAALEPWVGSSVVYEGLGLQYGSVYHEDGQIFGNFILTVEDLNNGGGYVAAYLKQGRKIRNHTEADSTRETQYKETSCSGIHKSNNRSKLRMDQHSVSPEVGIHGVPVDNFSRTGSGGVNLCRFFAGVELDEPESSNWNSKTSVKFEPIACSHFGQPSYGPVIPSAQSRVPGQPTSSIPVAQNAFGSFNRTQVGHSGSAAISGHEAILSHAFNAMTL
ncbi:outer envelope protein 80, chloroplastic [Tanacetum coccineum]